MVGLAGRLCRQVPQQYMFFANAVHQCPEYWEDEEQIRADLELEATGHDKVETFLSLVRAQRALVQRFLEGDLDQSDDAGVQAALVEVGLHEEEEDPMFKGMELNREQKRLEKALGKQVDRAKAGRLAANEQEWESVMEDAHQNARPLFVTGPPGNREEHSGGQDGSEVHARWGACFVCLTHGPAGV